MSHMQACNAPGVLHSPCPRPHGPTSLSKPPKDHQLQLRDSGLQDTWLAIKLSTFENGKRHIGTTDM